MRPRIASRHRPRHIPVLHQPEICLGHVLGPRDPPRGHPSPDTLKHLLLPLIPKPPKGRVHRPRLHQVDPDRLQIEGQIAHHAMQPGRVRGDNGPVRLWPLRHAARRDDDGALRARAQIAAADLGDQQRREEAHLAGSLDLLERRVSQRHDAERVAGGEDDVLDAADLLEERGEVLLQRRLRQVAWEAAHVRAGIGGLQALDGGLYAGDGGGGDGHGGGAGEAGFGDGVANAGGAAYYQDVFVGELVVFLGRHSFCHS